MRRIICFGLLFFSLFFLSSEGLSQGLTEEELEEARFLIDQIISENQKLETELERLQQSFMSVLTQLESSQTRLESVNRELLLSEQRRNDYETSLIKAIEAEKRRALRISGWSVLGGAVAGGLLIWVLN